MDLYELRVGRPICGNRDTVIIIIHITATSCDGRLLGTAGIVVGVGMPG